MELHPALIAHGIADRCDVIDVSKTKDEAQWLEARKGGLGSSDAAPAFGISPYKGAMELWLEKTGQVVPDDISDKEPVWWGTECEHLIAKRFAMKTELEVIDPGCMLISRHFGPRLRTNIDRFYIDFDGELGILECKMADSHLEGDWSDDLAPPWYQIQVAQQAAVAGVYRAKIACLIGGNNFQIRTLDLDRELVDGIAEQLLAWWERHVIGGEAPPVDGLQSTTDVLTKLYGKANADTSIELDPTVALEVARYHEAHARLKQAEEDKTLHGNRLREAMGAAESATFGGVPIVTWKSGTTTRLDEKEHAFRQPGCHALYSPTKDTRTLRPRTAKEALHALGRAEKAIATTGSAV